MTVGPIRFTTTSGGELLATFDGVLLDLFGADVPGQPASERFHRDLMTITIDEPDRKGNRKVVIYAGPGPGRKVPSRYILVAAQDRHVIEFFERVRAALPARAAGSG
jgi:hypothetical protein